MERPGLHDGHGLRRGRRRLRQGEHVARHHGRGRLQRHQSFTYTLNVPSGQTKRLQQYKAAKRFVVTKKRYTSTCSSVVVYSSTVTAPVKSGADRYFLYALVS